MDEPKPDFSLITRPIVTDEDADAALYLLSWMASKEAAGEADLKILIANARSTQEQQYRIEFDSAIFTYKEVRKLLNEELIKFTKAQRARLFVKRQTAEFTHGVIRQRKQSASVQLAEGVTEEDVLPKLSDQPRYVRTKQAIDFPAILSDRRKGLLTDEKLQTWGLVYDAGEGEKNVTINPK